MSLPLLFAFAAAFAPSFSGSASLEPQADQPSLVLETPLGEETSLPLAGLDLPDPRARGAWICRPAGVAAEPGEADGEGGGPAVRVELVGGDVLKARLLGGEGERLRLRLAAGLELELGIERLRALRFPDRIPGDRAIALEPPAEGDRLDRWTGREVDPIAGAVESFDAAGVRFDSETLGTRLVPWDEVAALFLEDLGGGEGGTVEGALPPVVLDFRDGSRLRGELVGMEERGCSLRIAGTILLVPWSAVVEVLIDDGRVRYLSEFEPLREKGRGSPFGDDLGMVWEHRMDECVTGGPMVARRAVVRRGIGMHAPSRLTFALDGGFSRLRGSCAIDDSSLRNPAAARGSVIFRVLLDDEPAFESPVVRGGDAPLAFGPIDLTGHRELTLELDPAGDFRGDRGNWLRPLLVR
ncbi:MAG TPA: hypothetical protein ENJ09_09355 [Planctomycetes bacterium]|nr:hypothetical protein [Planctomycetota bacterium]